MKELFAKYTLPATGVGVVVSLLLNVILLTQWVGLRNQIADVTPQIQLALDRGVGDLAAFRVSTIDFTVAVDESVSIDTTLPVREQFTLPINTSLPIDQAFDSRIEVQGPFGLGIPVTVNVPVKLDVPINLSIPVDLNTEVDVNLDVPLQLQVPLAIEVSETPLAELTLRLEASLRSLSNALGDLP